MGEADIAARLAVEYWKLLRAFERAVERIPEEHRAKTEAQLRFSIGRLDSLSREAGFALASFDGQVFAPNLPVAAVNRDDFGAEDVLLVVAATLEPAVIRDMQVVAMGKVVLAKEE